MIRSVPGTVYVAVRLSSALGPSSRKRSGRINNSTTLCNTRREHSTAAASAVTRSGKTTTEGGEAFEEFPLPDGLETSFVRVEMGKYGRGEGGARFDISLNPPRFIESARAFHLLIESCVHPFQVEVHRWFWNRLSPAATPKPYTGVFSCGTSGFPSRRRRSGRESFSTSASRTCLRWDGAS